MCRYSLSSPVFSHGVHNQARPLYGVLHTSFAKKGQPFWCTASIDFIVHQNGIRGCCQAVDIIFELFITPRAHAQRGVK